MVSLSYDRQYGAEDSNVERLTRVTKVCQASPSQHDIYSNLKHFRNILVDDQLKTLFCYIPKAGSTSWKYVLLNASKRQQQPRSAKDFRDIHTSLHKSLQRLDEYSFQEIKHRLENYFKFMIVRHPFERLGSAYYDRFRLIQEGNLEHGNAGTYRDYKDEISRKTANSGVNSSCIAFDRLVKYITLSDPVEYDEHWSLYDDVCSPCSIKYDYIGKVETMATDAPHIIRRLNITGIQLPSFHVHHKRNSSYLNYYNSVESGDIYKLMEIYSKDFDLFGYARPTVTVLGNQPKH